MAIIQFIIMCSNVYVECAVPSHLCWVIADRPLTLPAIIGRRRALTHKEKIRREQKLWVRYFKCGIIYILVFMYTCCGNVYDTLVCNHYFNVKYNLGSSQQIITNVFRVDVLNKS